jgi:hypothetical protein
MRKGIPNFFDSYRTRPDSLTLHTINGHRVLTWSGDYSNNGVAWSEQAGVIYAETGPIFVRLVGPTEQIEKPRPAFESFLNSIRLQ